MKLSMLSRILAQLLSIKMTNEELFRLICSLKEILKVGDLEIKNCALESIIDELEDVLVKYSAEEGEI